MATSIESLKQQPAAKLETNLKTPAQESKVGSEVVGSEVQDIDHFIFDFDCTLTWNGTDTSGKWGMDVPDDKNKYEDHQIKLNIKENTKHALLLCAIFNKIKAKGKDLSIASFHDGARKDPQEKYFEGGPKYIREFLTMGIEGFDFGTLRIRAYLPPNDVDPKEKPVPDKDNPVVLDGTNNVNHRIFFKNPFIDFLAKDANEQRKVQGKPVIDMSKRESRKRIVLIDDNLNNIVAANKEGYETIYVDLDKPYDYMLTLLEQLGFTNEELMDLKIELLAEVELLKEKNACMNPSRDANGSNSKVPSNVASEPKAQAEIKLLMEINTMELKYLSEIIEQRIKKKLKQESSDVDEDFLQELIGMEKEKLEVDLKMRVKRVIYKKRYTSTPDNLKGAASGERLRYTSETQRQTQGGANRSAMYFSRWTKDFELSKSGEQKRSAEVMINRHQRPLYSGRESFATESDIAILKDPRIIVRIDDASKEIDGFRFQFRKPDERTLRKRVVTWEQAKEIMDARGTNFYNAEQRSEAEAVIKTHLSSSSLQVSKSEAPTERPSEHPRYIKEKGGVKQPVYIKRTYEQRTTIDLELWKKIEDPRSAVLKCGSTSDNMLVMYELSTSNGYAKLQVTPSEAQAIDAVREKLGKNNVGKNNGGGN